MRGKVYVCTPADPWRPDRLRATRHPDARCDAGPAGGMATWRCPNCGIVYEAQRVMDRVAADRE